MSSVGIIGGRGYVGEELIRLLLAHPEFEIGFVSSRSLGGQRLDQVFEAMDTDLAFSTFSPDEAAAADVDHLVLALPNGLARDFAEPALAAGKGVLDISADYRFDSGWVYGLPEFNRDRLAGARPVSNPGCYATAAQLALKPLADQLAEAPSVFGVSGYSGAGRTPSERNNPERLADNLLPYKLAGHGHESEIGHQLGHQVRFMPHVAQFFRGISVTVSATMFAPVDAEGLLAKFNRFYQDAPLVRVQPEIPEIAQVRNRPGAVIGGFTVDPRDPHRVTVVSCIDNLQKGAASQALQNLNLMAGFDELLGLNEPFSLPSS